MNEAFVCWGWFEGGCLSAVWIGVGDREIFK